MKKQIVKSGLIMLVFLLSFSFTKAQTSFTDDFSDGTTTGWSGGKFTLTEANGELAITGVRTSLWDAISCTFPKTDISSKPYLNLKIKSNFNLNLIVGVGFYKKKADGTNAFAVVYPARIKVHSNNYGSDQEIGISDIYQEYCFDYSTITYNLSTGETYNGFTGPVNLTASQVLSGITNLNFLPNPLAIYPGSSVANPTLWIDDLVLGVGAQSHPSIASVENLTLTVRETGSLARTIDLRNITDGSTDNKTITITATSSNTNLLPNPVISYTTGRFGSITLNPIDNQIGTSTISVNVSAPGTDKSKVMTFKVNVVPNAAPEMKPIENLLVNAGEKIRIPLINVNDKNIDVEQNINVTASSSDNNIIPTPVVVYDNVTKTGYVELTPNAAATPGSKATITVTLTDDGGTTLGGINQKSYPFEATVYTGVNKVPKFDLINNIGVPAVAGNKTVEITGISDGDNANQNLTWTITNSNTNVVSNVSVGTITNATATLTYSLTGEIGIDTVTIRLTDDGGTANNNGNLYLEQKFVIETQEAAATGVVIRFDENNTPESYGFRPETGYTLTVEDGKLHVKCDYPANKFPGMWWDLKTFTGGKEVDISKNPYVQIVLKSSLANNNGLDDQTLIRMHLWDHDPLPDKAYSNTSTNIYTPEEDKYKTHTFDFSGKFITTEKGQIDSTRINQILINLDNRVFYPVKGDYWFDEIRVGDSIIFDFPKVNTIDDVAGKVHVNSDTQGTILLKGISDGNGKAATGLTYSLSNASIFTTSNIDLVVNGESNFRYTLNGTIGDCVVTVVADDPNSATDITDTTRFTISVVDPLVTNAIVTIDKNTEYQKYTGLGGVVKGENVNNLVEVCNDLNWTLVRIFGQFDNIEPVNDNDDPYTTARENLVVNMDVMREIKEMNEKTNCHNFFYTPLTPPAWMKLNKSAYPYTNAMFATNNALNPSYYEEFGEFLISIVRAIKEHAGVELKAISIQNEPQFNEPYASMKISRFEFIDIMKVVGPMFQNAGLTTRILMSDDVANNGFIDRVTAVNNDTEARKYIGALGYHGYAADGIGNSLTNIATFEEIATLAKTTNADELWMTESSGWNDAWEGAWGKSWDGKAQFQEGSLNVAAGYITMFKAGKVNGWTDLNTIKSLREMPNLSALMKQFTKYVNPGDIHISTVSNNDDVKCIAFKNPSTGNIAVNIINLSFSSGVVSLAGADLPTAFSAIASSNNDLWKALPTVTNKVILAPRSSVTLYSVPVNVAPTIATIPNQVMILSEGAKTIQLNDITDGNPEDNQDIIITAESSDAQVASVSVNYSNGNPTGNLVITPLTSGTSTISVVLKDNGGVLNGGSDTKKVSFTVNVLNDINHAPTLDAINNVNILEDAAKQTITLTGISDGDTGSQSLNISVLSSNTDLIPTPTLTYTNGANTAIIEFTPVANLSGSSSITVQIADNGGNSNNNGDQMITKTFDVVVAEVNDKPVISEIADIALTRYRSSFNLVFTANDGDDDKDQTMSYTIESSDPAYINPEIIGANEIKLNCLQNKAGSATITLTAKDNGGTANGGIDTATESFVFMFNITGLPEIAAEKITVYPVPASNRVFFDMKDQSWDAADVSVYNATGICIVNGMKYFQGTNQLSVANLSNGMYYMTFTKNGKRAMVRFVVNN